MAKWNRAAFIEHAKSRCPAHVINVMEDLIGFIEDEADTTGWGRGEERGMISFKARSDEGLLPLFYLTTDGQMKFHVNYLRNKNTPKEILRDYQLRLESTFLLELSSEHYPQDVFFSIDDLFHTQNQVDKFKHAIRGVKARFHQ